MPEAAPVTIAVDPLMSMAREPSDGFPAGRVGPMASPQLSTPRLRGSVLTALALAVVLAWFNGILVRTVTVNVQFFGETADRSDYRVAAGAGLMTALLLVLGLAALRVLSAPSWLQYLAAVGIATQLGFGITAWWSSREIDDSVVVTKSAWDGVKDVLVLPGSWPLLLLLVVAVVVAVRGRSDPTPR
jgi:hypothetical protein